LPRMPAALAAVYPDTRPTDWIVFTDENSHRVWCHSNEFSVRVSIRSGSIVKQQELCDAVSIDLLWDGRAPHGGRWVWLVRSSDEPGFDGGSGNGPGSYGDCLAAARAAARALACRHHHQIPHHCRMAAAATKERR
jgi:hypothetical protein